MFWYVNVSQILPPHQMLDEWISTTYKLTFLLSSLSLALSTRSLYKAWTNLLFCISFFLSCCHTQLFRYLHKNTRSLSTVNKADWMWCELFCCLVTLLPSCGNRCVPSPEQCVPCCPWPAHLLQPAQGSLCSPAGLQRQPGAAGSTLNLWHWL